MDAESATLRDGMPSEATQSSWLRWATWSVVALSGVAAIGLVVTVLVARAGMTDASGLLVRAEGQHLLALVHNRLREEPGPPTTAALETILRATQGEGLRYVAVREVQQGTWIAAGSSALDDGATNAGSLRIVSSRARLVDSLPLPAGRAPPGPPAGNPPVYGPLADDAPPFDAPPASLPPNPLSIGIPPRPPLIAIEFEAPVVSGLARSVERTATAGYVAVLFLLASGFVLARYLARQAEAARVASRQQRLVALGEMSAVMAHELRNPIASLKGNAQLLLETLDPTLDAGRRQHDKAARVVREAERLERLTSDLLDFVRDAPLSLAAVTTRTLLDRALEGTPEGRVDVEVTDAPPSMYVDEARIGGALANLVRNALQATPKDARVCISIMTKGEGVQIDVRDHGAGLPSGGEERIFEPFFTTQVRGTGLGLAVARRAVEQHGGTLRGETHAGGGAVFSVVIPGAIRSGSAPREAR